MKRPAGFNQTALSLAFASMPAGTSVLTTPLTASTAGVAAPLRVIAGSATGRAARSGRARGDPKAAQMSFRRVVTQEVRACTTSS